ncbi:hypothetical protein E2553_45765 [Paraburkholderia dipogonis]|uniref:Uncharacterized protein n=1 Tax=Paraburkholderia dipogonis TaxID=1211383 RepID=A0A4Y8MHL1_9BURK|nr:hypothetical protein [Paraburkholderia dipogonis]TFE36937.1 hypothetical protein E2553_45765 [Paraburkholderia dipogonis]
MSMQIIDLSSLRERLTIPATRDLRTVASTPEVNALLDTDAVVATARYDSLLAARATAGAMQSEPETPAQKAFVF